MNLDQFLTHFQNAIFETSQFPGPKYVLFPAQKALSLENHRMILGITPHATLISTIFAAVAKVNPYSMPKIFLPYRPPPAI
jgi:hypothetical protein